MFDSNVQYFTPIAGDTGDGDGALIYCTAGSSYSPQGTVVVTRVSRVPMAGLTKLVGYVGSGLDLFL